MLRKYMISGVIKVCDVIEAEDEVQAEMLMMAKYPQLRDKEVGITNMQEIRTEKFAKKGE